MFRDDDDSRSGADELRRILSSINFSGREREDKKVGVKVIKVTDNNINKLLRSHEMSSLAAMNAYASKLSTISALCSKKKWGKGKYQLEAIETATELLKYAGNYSVNKSQKELTMLGTGLAFPVVELWESCVKDFLNVLPNKDKDKTLLDLVTDLAPEFVLKLRKEDENLGSILGKSIMSSLDDLQNYAESGAGNDLEHLTRYDVIGALNAVKTLTDLGTTRTIEHNVQEFLDSCGENDCPNCGERCAGIKELAGQAYELEDKIPAAITEQASTLVGYAAKMIVRLSNEEFSQIKNDLYRLVIAAFLE